MHAASLLLLVALAPMASSTPRVSETRPAMGTVVTVTVEGVAAEEAAPAVEAAFALFARVDEAMNEWRPGSPVSALNAAAGNGRWIELPADLCEVLRAARRGAERTGGLFDPTWAALRSTWRFGDGERFTLPGDAEVSSACARVGWRGLEIEPAAAAARRTGGDGAASCRARLDRPGMQVGLGGIAKGWAVDRAAAELRRRGVARFTLQAGGDLYASAGPGGHPWRVGVRDPRGAPGDAFAWLEVTDAAFSTSGDSERFAVVDGVRHHHVIDPRTCRPATASRQASVLAPTALEAEVLGKAVFILGGEEGLRLAERLGGAAVVVAADGRVTSSASLAGRLELPRAPLP